MRTICLQAGPRVHPSEHMHTHTVYAEDSFSLSLSLCLYTLYMYQKSQEEDRLFTVKGASRLVVSYLDSARTIYQRHGIKLHNYAAGRGLAKQHCFLNLILFVEDVRKSGL